MAADTSIRVVLCTPGFPLSRDDSDKPFLLDHARALRDQGLEVTVVCPAVAGAPSRQTIEAIRVVRTRYAPRSMQTLAATGSMYKEARGIKALLAFPMMVAMCVAAFREARREPTVLYGHWWIPGGIVAAIAGSLTRQPSIVHLHGSDAAITKGKILRMIARQVFKRVDVRLAASCVLANWGQSISNKTFTVLPMPIRLAAPIDSSPLVQEHMVLGVGRLVPEKGFDLLLRAIGQIPQSSRPPIAIVGSGPERDRLKTLAKKLNIDLHLPGAVPPSEMSAWYYRSHVVAVPSLREGFGMVAAEAAAAGRAVVATRVGAHCQIVADGISGLLIEPGDVDALKQALLDIDPQWGINGPQRVAPYKADEHGGRLKEICESLLN